VVQKQIAPRISPEIHHIQTLDLKTMIFRLKIKKNNGSSMKVIIHWTDFQTLRYPLDRMVKELEDNMTNILIIAITIVIIGPFFLLLLLL